MRSRTKIVLKYCNLESWDILCTFANVTLKRM